MSDHIADVDAIVAGGGIGGLNAAYQLSKRGIAPMVLEARGRTGGLVFGGDLGGVTVDLGAESFAKRSRYALELCRELGLPTIDACGRSWIWSYVGGGHAVRIPHGVLGIPASLDDPDVACVLSAAGLARAREDSAMGPAVGADCRDMASLVETRLGREVLDRLVTPVAGGIHSTHPSRLSVDVVAPGLRPRLAEEGSLVAAAAAQRAAAPSGAVISSVEGGLYRLPTTLAERIVDAGGEVWNRMLVTAIRRDGVRWLVTVDNAGNSPVPHLPGAPSGRPFTLRTRRLVVALDGRSALGLLRGVGDLRIGDWELPAGADLASIDLAVDNPALDAAPRGSGVLVTPLADGQASDIEAKALTHYSVKWPWVVRHQRHHVLRVSYGRGRGTPVPTPAQALRDASELLGVPITPDQVRGDRLVRFPDSLPPPTPAHRERVARLAEAVGALPGLAVTGAWFAGTGLAAVLPHAEAAAVRVAGVTVEA